MALLFCSSQNLDRIVSAYKAAIRTDRILVIDLYTAFVLVPKLDDFTIIWSMWTGYLTGEDILSKLCAELALTIEQIHTSGHAPIKDLKRLAMAINPQFLIPIHTFHPNDYEQFGIPVRILEDGETMEL